MQHHRGNNHGLSHVVIALSFDDVMCLIGVFFDLVCDGDVNKHNNSITVTLV